MVDRIRHLLLPKLAVLLYFVETSAAVQQCSAVCDFYEWGKDARCQGRNLGAVPQECVLAKTLRMQDNQLPRLAPGTFENFTSLKYLYLGGNNMTVEAGSFRGCVRLEKVDLNQNHIPVLTEGILDGMPHMMYMFLDNTSIGEIQPEAFVNLPHLKFLSLEDNQITAPPCDAFGSENTVNTLYLTGNRISYLPNDCFSSFNHLDKLYLRRNPLFIPNPLAFKGLDSLTLLDLQYTNLTEVPTGIFQQAVNIEKLYLSYNNISHLSNRDFMSLYRLTHLHLQHNNLIVIQEWSFEFLGALEMLDISFNRISSMNENTLTHIGNVIDVKVQGNPLHCDCSLGPLLILSKASSSDALGEYHDPSQYARCESPPELAGRLLISLQQSDVCPSETQVTYASLTSASAAHPDQDKRERLQVPDDGSSDIFPSMIIIIAAVATVLTAVLLSVSLCLLHRMKQRAREKDSKRWLKGKNAICRPESLEITRYSPSLPRQSINDKLDTPYYLTIDGEDQCHSPVPRSPHPCYPLHHPMPPRFSSEKDLASEKLSTSIGEPTKDDIVYSSVLPDDVPHAKLDRTPSVISELPIDEWLKNNLSLDPSTISTTVDDSPVPSLIEGPTLTPAAGTPYVTIVTQK